MQYIQQNIIFFKNFTNCMKTSDMQIFLHIFNYIRLCAQPGLASGCFGAKDSLGGRPVTPVEAVGAESETGVDVNGRGPEQVGGGRSGGPGGCVAGSHTAWCVVVSV